MLNTIKTHQRNAHSWNILIILTSSSKCRRYDEIMIQMVNAVKICKKFKIIRMSGDASSVVCCTAPAEMNWFWQLHVRRRSHSVCDLAILIVWTAHWIEKYLIGELIRNQNHVIKTMLQRPSPCFFSSVCGEFSINVPGGLVWFLMRSVLILRSFQAALNTAVVSSFRKICRRMTKGYHS